MKILMYQWNAYNHVDVYHSILALGHDITCYQKQPENIEEDTEYVEKLCEILTVSDYQLLFSINYFPVLAEACKESGIPYVCWTCDSPLLAMYHQSVFYDTNFIFVFDRSVYEQFKILGCPHIYHLPLAANVNRIHNFLSSRSKMLYDISFVGSLYENNSFDPIAKKLPDYLCGYLEGTLQAQTLVSGGNLIEKLLTPEICEQLEDIVNYKRSKESFADIRMLFSTTVLGFKAASITRRRSLSELAKYFQVNLFTNSDTTLLPFVNTHPPVDYHFEMPNIFFQSKINLNMTIPNIQTGIPLRVWDILSSKGFLMTDFRTELLDYFVPEKDFVLFEDMDELLAKTDFYLKHEEERDKIIANATKKIQADHHCQQRMATLFSILKQELGKI